MTGEKDRGSRNVSPVGAGFLQKHFLNTGVPEYTDISTSETPYIFAVPAKYNLPGGSPGIMSNLPS